jgi:hypothetical protein
LGTPKSEKFCLLLTASFLLDLVNDSSPVPSLHPRVQVSGSCLVIFCCSHTSYSSFSSN